MNSNAAQGCVKLMETFEGGQYSYAVMEMLGPNSSSDCFRWVFDILDWENEKQIIYYHHPWRIPEAIYDRHMI